MITYVIGVKGLCLTQLYMHYAMLLGTCALYFRALLNYPSNKALTSLKDLEVGFLSPRSQS